MARAWARRTTELHAELAELAERDPRWWVLAGGAAAAEALRARSPYLFSDAEPAADTFIGSPAPAPGDPIWDAIIRAHAARAALRELDGELPGQPLAVTVRRDPTRGAHLEPTALATAAFALGARVLVAELADDLAGEGPLAAQLAAVCAGHPPPPRPRPTPFVCVSIGEEPWGTARHGHRRAWQRSGPDGSGSGPWLGLGRAGGLATVSTCHLVIDGYGHTWLAARIAAHAARLTATRPPPTTPPPALPALAAVPGGLPLGVAWRPLPAPAPRALPLAYALGRALHHQAGHPEARFSPTLQVPIAPGATSDPARVRRRVVHAVLSVRFDAGAPEPYDVFATRAKGILAREAAGTGLVARLTAAARAAPLSLAWKRKSLAGGRAGRAGWLDRVAEIVGGRACLSRIELATPGPRACAVSAPARLGSPADPRGGYVVTVIADPTGAAITLCGSGLASTDAGAAALLDELLALVP